MEDGEVEEEGMLVEEEEEMDQKLLKSPFELLHETKSSIEDIVSQMLSIKKQSKPKSQLRELATQMFIHFLNLRKANRAILMEEDRVKAQTENAKAPVDFTTLQLHNLMYEKGHYIKAIKACKDFKSKYPDIDLVPEEDFFRDAPHEIQSSVLSNDTAHNLTLKRLDFELHQRKELCKLREKLEQRKKRLQETIAGRKKFLSSLPSHLKSLKKASLPVQNQLGVLHTKKLKQHHSAELLPPPLYVLYSQLAAQKEAFGEQIELEIAGSVKDAQAFAHRLANPDLGNSASLESSRMDDDVAEEEDDGQRRRKRTKKIPTKENLDQAGVHPLKVMLHVYDDEASDPKSAKLVTLKFEYLLKLNVVCVGIEGCHDGPEYNILCNLFPDDTGLELPHQSAKLIAGDSLVFDEKRTSRPYKWAQHLAGIDFLPELAPLLSGQGTPSAEVVRSDSVVCGLSLYRQQSRVTTVVQRIRSRKKAQLALVEQLDSLMKLQWPSLSCESVPWALHKLSCNLHGCSPVGPAPTKVSSLPLIDLEQVPQPPEVDERSGNSKEELENNREDGELGEPTASAPNPSTISDSTLSPPKESDLELSRPVALLSKSIATPPVNKMKSQSFKRLDEDSILMDIDSDPDEPVYKEPEEEQRLLGNFFEADKKWVNYGAREFSLVLTRNTGVNSQTVKLEAKIKIGAEYPLRPPLFALSIFTSSGGENHYNDNGSEWYNELRAIEAEVSLVEDLILGDILPVLAWFLVNAFTESNKRSSNSRSPVNLHMLKLVPPDEEEYVLGHQTRCLAMLFDYYIDDMGSSKCEKIKKTSVLDIGLCKPVMGQLVARSYRGRDRRKMISWKDMKCNPGYPY